MELAQRPPSPPIDGEPDDRAWHARAADAVLAEFGSERDGLSEAEAAARLSQYGPNALIGAPAESVWRIFVRQLRSVVVALLVTAAALAWWLGEPLDAAAIGAVLILNVVIGFATEWRARRAMEALLHLETPTAMVLRDGAPRSVDGRELVPGDVIHLEAGQSIPADARLLSATELLAIEAPLTGESTPVKKSANSSLPVKTPLPERRTMVYKGTLVANGAARALVVETGMKTEVGRIGALVSSIGEEQSPLERRMDVLGRQLAGIAVALGAAVAIVDLLRGATLGAVLQMGIAVAIAAVPEGLPAVVTTTMAIAMRRMARRHALARRLTAVETLGSVTVVCTDKTGTLTSGTQTVTRMWLADGERSLGDGSATVTPHDGPLVRALTIGALANRAALLQVDDHWQGRGDPTDVAFLAAARRYMLIRAELAAEQPEVAELPFTSERMFMATFHRSADGVGLIACTKGAPHRILSRCTRLALAGDEHSLDDDWRRRVRERAAAMAKDGLRVLALAEGRVLDTTEGALEGLTFVALAGITDPIAPGVSDTIALLRQAGIRTIMLTGDHVGTALAVARQVGVATENQEAIDGATIDSTPDANLDSRVRRIDVVSRVSPEGKLRVVASLQRSGEIVAMLGDGINDAAALKKANIGVAMGQRGTDAAKEVADIILEDDRFPTIAAAVEEGRVVVANIRKFVFYLFSCNIAEVLVLLVAGMAGWPLPMTPMQVLWLNLVTDTFPALALAIEPGEQEVLRQPPRDPHAPLLSRKALLQGVIYTLIISAVTLGALAWGLAERPGDSERAITLSFTTLALAQIFHLGNARSIEAVTSLHRALANRYALGAVALTAMLQFAAVAYLPLGRILGTVRLTASEWLVAIALGAAPAVLGQAWKLRRSGRRHYEHRTARFVENGPHGGTQAGR